MSELWYVLLVASFGVYVLLDGFDLGAGALHLFVARDGAERHRVMRAVAPVWDGNEVWLIAGGGTLFAAFPRLFAAGFSSFYLPLMVALWLLVLRALAIELQHQSRDAMWLRFWDVVFAGSSALLALVFGVALANVVRGVPFDGGEVRFVPLWTDFRLRGEVGLFDAYTLLVGLTALLVLAQHGAAWLALRLARAPLPRLAAASRRLWPAASLAALFSTAATFAVRPGVLDNLRAAPVLFAFPLLSLAGVAGTFPAARTRPRTRFLASAALLLGLLGSAAASLWPQALPSSFGSGGLSLHDAAAGPAALRTMLWWWLPGMALAAGYSAWVYRNLPAVED
ncbi:MAG: cytochrome d ubiquinol oxidase subunit II [Planctomycetes bacterium]|nr:cytochrome d ubiquinol oxidase subunit II [Planctomycetota bacterium]